LTAEPHRLAWRQKHRKRKTSSLASNQSINTILPYFSLLSLVQKLSAWRRNKESCLSSLWEVCSCFCTPQIPRAPAHSNKSPSQANIASFIADQLIGTGAQGRNSQLSITDPKVCRSYIVGTCPHDLFTNTKQDLGPCPKVHNEGLKTEYDTASTADKAKWGFEFDYLRDMQKYIDDCDRRIDTAQRRLEKTPDEIRQTNDLVRFVFSIFNAV
jgi:hypothetical protein